MAKKKPAKGKQITSIENVEINEINCSVKTESICKVNMRLAFYVRLSFWLMIILWVMTCIFDYVGVNISESMLWEGFWVTVSIFCFVNSIRYVAYCKRRHLKKGFAITSLVISSLLVLLFVCGVIYYMMVAVTRY